MENLPPTGWFVDIITTYVILVFPILYLISLIKRIKGVQLTSAKHDRKLLNGNSVTQKNII